MQGIFISYRRQETAGYAGRLHAQLAKHFGEERVFMDVEGIEPGVDFVEEIERAVASCEVLIVIIGTGWLGTDSTGKRRLDDPKDFVHIETAAALARQIRVVPVLVDGAAMPRKEELPADLAPLARRQAIELSNKHWDATSAELIRTLERILDGEASLSPLLIKRGRPRFWAIAGMLALVVAAVGIYLSQPWREAVNSVPQAERAPIAPPADTVATRPTEKTAPIAEKTPALSAEKTPPPAAEIPASPTPDKPALRPAEKPAAPTPDKASPRPAEKPPAPPTEKTLPRPTEKPPAPSAEKAAPRPAEKPAAPSAAPPARGTDTASAPAPADDKAATAPARPAEKPSAPVAAAPATPPVTAPVAPPAALPATLPRVGDSWEYRMRSKWKTVEPRTYAHRVTAVSAREVAETMSVGANADGATVRQAFTTDSRWVEWRGQGFWFLEFNPFLEAFGGLQNAAGTLQVPAMPAENPFHANWYGSGRVRGYESVSVPAGTFKALKVEIDSSRNPTESLGGRSHEPVRTILTLWYAAEVKRTVKMLRIVLTPDGMHLDEDTYELVKYRVQ